MEKGVLFFQIIISILLIFFILIQSKETRSTPRIETKGFFDTKTKKEKTTFIITIILASLFLLGAVLNTLIFLR